MAPVGAPHEDEIHRHIAQILSIDETFFRIVAIIKPPEANEAIGDLANAY